MNMMLIYRPQFQKIKGDVKPQGHKVFAHVSWVLHEPQTQDPNLACTWQTRPLIQIKVDPRPEAVFLFLLRRHNHVLALKRPSSIYSLEKIHHTSSPQESCPSGPNHYRLVTLTSTLMTVTAPIIQHFKYWTQTHLNYLSQGLSALQLPSLHSVVQRESPTPERHQDFSLKPTIKLVPPSPMSPPVVSQ